MAGKYLSLKKTQNTAVKVAAAANISVVHQQHG